MDAMHDTAQAQQGYWLLHIGADLSFTVTTAKYGSNKSDDVCA